MKAKIVQFRRGKQTYHKRHFLVLVESIKNKKEAAKMIGKEITWKSPGKKEKIIKGKISAAHGNKGLLRAIFENGLPGQALTTSAEIRE